MLTHAHRLRRLSHFQEKALLHALAFPSVRRVVYCTCSVHEQENEHVVAAGTHFTCFTSTKVQKLTQKAVLSKTQGWALEKALPAWPRRGLVSERFDERLADCCIRVDPLADGAHGFFIACLVRK